MELEVFFVYSQSNTQLWLHWRISVMFHKEREHVVFVINGWRSFGRDLLRIAVVDREVGSFYFPELKRTIQLAAQINQRLPN